MQDTFIYKGQTMNLEDAFQYLLRENASLKATIQENYWYMYEVEKELRQLIMNGNKTENEVRLKLNNLTTAVYEMRFAHNLL
jgi:hypothetical protein